MSVEMYRQFKRNAGPAADRLETGDGPADIVAEERLAEKLRREPGLFKKRDTPPNVFVQAAKTPGELAKMIVFVVTYLVLMGSVIALAGERVMRVPGIFQVIGLGLLAIPTMMITTFVWEAIGEVSRGIARMLVRFWPVTFIALIFILGIIRTLLQ